MEQWYVLKAIFRKELAVRDGLRQAGLTCYVPLHYRIETQRGRKVRRLVPAITELVFVRGDEATIRDAKELLPHPSYWLVRPVLGQQKPEKVVVRDRDMQHFIRVTEQTEANVLYFRPDEVRLSKGDRIRVHGGPFDGVEGVLLKVKGRRDKQLVVSIADLAIAAVSIRPDIVEVIDEHPEGSHDILGDTRTLMRLSASMLASPPDRDGERHEWNMMHREILRLYHALRVRQGVIAATEGRLALALLMAERVMGAVSDETRQRCKAAVARMRPSMLREEILKQLSSD